MPTEYAHAAHARSAVDGFISAIESREPGDMQITCEDALLTARGLLRGALMAIEESGLDEQTRDELSEPVNKTLDRVKKALDR